MRFALLALTAALLGAAQSPSTIRLPDTAWPVRYEAELTIDPGQPELEGRMEIPVKFSAEQSSLWMNAKDLTILAAAWDGDAAKFETVANELLRVDLPHPSREGTLEIMYRARLSDKGLLGAYRRQVAGLWYVFTTFTPIEARRVFPCFDEPRFKAPWRLTLRVPKDLTAAANYPAAHERMSGAWRTVEFAETRPLPSEVIAFAVGPFDRYEGATAGVDHVPVRVLTPKGLSAAGREAAEASDGVVRWLENYTGQHYPWPKLDHVALPEGAFGAVENPGLITYRQRGILAPASGATPEWRRHMRNLQAHELSHQWFGNLVTQADWTEVWLSEGFATFLAAKFAGDSLAIVSAREHLFDEDAGPRARPVRKTFTDRASLADVYSGVVYAKGAATLAELESWLGAEALQNALRRYLTLHLGANATTADLAEALGGGQSATVLSSMLDQTGVPHVRGELTCKARVQAMLFGDRTEPVCYETDRAKKSCAVLQGGSLQIHSADETCPAWIFLNAGARGYYRSVYTARQMEALATQAWPTLDAAERLTAVLDAVAQLKDGSLTRDDVRPLAQAAARDSVTRIAEAAKPLTSQ